LPSEFYDDVLIKDLYDIRDCKAYKSFIEIIGSSVNLKENGY
jgi:hypothetical protein